MKISPREAIASATCRAVAFPRQPCPVHIFHCVPDWNAESGVAVLKEFQMVVFGTYTDAECSMRPMPTFEEGSTFESNEAGDGCREAR